MSTAPSASGKPAGITAAIVIAILLAAWEAVSAIVGLAGSSALEGVQDALTRLPIGNAGEARAQLARLQEVITAAVTPQQRLALAALTLPVSALTIVAAVRLNKGKRHSARWFAHAVTALAAVEVIQLVLAVHLNRTMQTLMSELLGASIPPPATLPANVDPTELVRTMQTVVQVVTITGMVLGLGFAAGKIVACLYARHCARKPAAMLWTR